MENILQSVASGILVGSIYGLAALGLSLAKAARLLSENRTEFSLRRSS